MIKHFLMLALLAVILPLKAETFLSNAGSSAYCIVLPDQPTALEQTAAEELKGCIAAVTGAELPILSENARSADQPGLFVGNTRRAQEIFKNEIAQWPMDTIALKSSGSDLIMVGHYKRGTLYAVYEFIEKTLGVRFWTSSETYYPQRPTLELPQWDYQYTPVLIHRDTFYLDLYKNPAFASKLRVQGVFNPIPKNYGSQELIIGKAHTFKLFLPARAYFPKFPEWYSMIDGKRVGSDLTQLCLTNKAMLREMVRRCLDYLRLNPEMKMISVSQNDNRNRCQCPECLEVERIEGSQSGPLIRFVNAVAAEIGKRYPDVLVETLAYEYTRQPPKVTKPADNVLIRLCGIEVNYAQSIEDGADNRDFRADIENWSKITKQLFIWNYIVNAKDYFSPYPNWTNLSKDLRFFIKNRTIGLFEQGDYGSVNGDFIRARAYVISKLMWNPQLEQRQVMEEFFHGYYGPAGKYLLEYIDYMESLAAQNNGKLYCLRTNHSSYLTPQAFPKAYEIYAKAEAAVEKLPVFAKRVRRERLSLDHIYLQFIKQIRRDAAIRGVQPIFPRDIKLIAREFAEMIQPDEEFKEANKVADYAKRLQQVAEPPAPLPEMCKHLAADKFDIFEEYNFILHRSGSECFQLKDPQAGNGYAVKIMGDKKSWHIQQPLERIYGNNKKWRINLAVRTEGKANDGLAFTYGVYDALTRKNLGDFAASVKQTKGKKYTIVSTPPIAIPESNVLIYVMAAGRPLKELEGVWVDRIFMTAAE